MNVTNPNLVGMSSDQLQRIGAHLGARYVEAGKIPGSVTLVARRSEICYLESLGLRDLERETPMSGDTIFRIYSMTKPVVSVALMTLYERGLFSLQDPVHRFIPEWRNLRVFKGGSLPLFDTVPCQRPMTVRDLLMHTSGLTYDFMRASNVDYAYRKLGVGRAEPGYTLRDMVLQLAELPLEFSPGQRWNYSVSTDVLGYLIEVLSGMSLPEYLAQTLFEPLGMSDTGFQVDPGKVERMASCYERNPDKQLVLQDDGQHSQYAERTFYSGGGGLLSTIGDYYRFCQMLLSGGSLHGHRVLGSRTIDFMTRNHLPGGVDMPRFATGTFSETNYEGVGFGLGFANKVSATANSHPGTEGQYFWGGLASTLFWIDPVEDLVVIFMTQLIPSSTFNFRGQLEALVYAALD
jgi:CubicO group peptidase (beta-lactamase class C family)